jgi:hypothetical protein
MGPIGLGFWRHAWNFSEEIVMTYIYIYIDISKTPCGRITAAPFPSGYIHILDVINKKCIQQDREKYCIRIISFIPQDAKYPSWLK